MMRMIPGAWRLCAAAMMLGVSSGASAAPEDTLKEIQAQIDALQKHGTINAGAGSLVIESWLLSSTAIKSSAAKIRIAVTTGEKLSESRSILVVAGDEAPDFSQAAMLGLEIEALTDRLRTTCECDVPPSKSGPKLMSVPIAMFGMIAGLLKSDTDLTAIEQDVDAKLLAAAVAVELKATMPTTAVNINPKGELLTSFTKLVAVANRAQQVHDAFPDAAKLNDAQKAQKERLAAVLARYDAFYARVTTANAAGAVPLVVAARLQNLIKDDPYILRVNTEKAGGTLVKRTNILTALGAESVFISSGLVSSYELTDPETGQVVKAGIVTCRTTLTSLKRVQNASWKNADETEKATAHCSS